MYVFMKNGVFVFFFLFENVVCFEYLWLDHITIVKGNKRKINESTFTLKCFLSSSSLHRKQQLFNKNIVTARVRVYRLHKKRLGCRPYNTLNLTLKFRLPFVIIVLCNSINALANMFNRVP